MDENSEFGLQITTKSKEQVLSCLEEYLRASNLKINSERTVDELLTFIVTDTGKIIADEGYHDDLVMSLALASFCHTDVVDSSPVVPTGTKEEDVSTINSSFKAPLNITTNEKKTEDISWLIK